MLVVWILGQSLGDRLLTQCSRSSLISVGLVALLAWSYLFKANIGHVVFGDATQLSWLFLWCALAIALQLPLIKAGCQFFSQLPQLPSVHVASVLFLTAYLLVWILAAVPAIWIQERYEQPSMAWVFALVCICVVWRYTPVYKIAVSTTVVPANFAKSYSTMNMVLWGLRWGAKNLQMNGLLLYVCCFYAAHCLFWLGTALVVLIDHYLHSPRPSLTAALLLLGMNLLLIQRVGAF